MDKYDLIIIGAGPAGYEGAIYAAKNGLKVMLAERGEAGGTCLNRGCIPAKALLQCAHTYHKSITSEAFGVYHENTTYDIAKFYEYKNQVIQKLRDGVEQLLRANGVVLCSGTARIVSTSEVEIEKDGISTNYQAEHILIATGSVPAVPPIPGATLPGVFTSDGIFENARLYDRIVIVGGGVIGMEFAEYFTALGKEVTVIEALDRILANMDKEISQSLSMIMKKKGVTIHTGASVKEIKSAEPLLVEFEDKNGIQSVPCDAVLLAVGRRPVTSGLWADSLELKMERGQIVVDANQRTSLPGIWAAGDAAQGVMLAHYAAASACNAIDAICGKTPERKLSTVPSCVYTEPEIACCGLTEAEAVNAGIQVRCGKYSTLGNSRSIISSDDRGFIKIVSEASTGKIIGTQLMCSRASDMIMELASAISNELTFEDLTKTIHPHPSYCEAVLEAAEDIEGMALHIMPRKR
jgi:dihydrolipoamide dehydrogenase